MSYNLSQVPPGAGRGWCCWNRQGSQRWRQQRGRVWYIAPISFFTHSRFTNTHTSVFLFLLINFYWFMVALQCCVSTVQQNESAIHVHICIPFGLPSHSGHHRPLKEFPVLCCRFSLVIYVIHSINSVYVSIPISQFLPLLPFPLGSCASFGRSLFSRSVVSDSSQPHRLQHCRLPCPSPSPRAGSDSCILSWWCHPTVWRSYKVLLFHGKLSFSFKFSWYGNSRNSAGSLQASLLLRTEMCGQETDLSTSCLTERQRGRIFNDEFWERFGD